MDQNINFNVKANAGQAEKTFQSITTEIGTMKSSIASIAGKLGLAFGGYQLVAFAKQALTAAADLEVLRGSFKGTTETMNLFKKATTDSLSEMSLLKLSNYASDLNLTLEQQAIAFSLAEDSADKYGTSIEEGFGKFVGASEGMKKALKGIGISQADYDKAVKEVLKSTGYRIEQLDMESQKQVRIDAIIKASGLTLNDVNNKLKDNADKIKSASVAWEELTVAVGKLLNSPTMIRFFELTAKATQGWAIILGGKDSSIAGSQDRKLAYYRSISDLSKEALSALWDQLEAQKAINSEALKNVVWKTEGDDLRRSNRILEERLDVLKNMDKYLAGSKITGKDNPLNLSAETLAKMQEAKDKIFTYDKALMELYSKQKTDLIKEQAQAIYDYVNAWGKNPLGVTDPLKVKTLADPDKFKKPDMLGGWKPPTDQELYKNTLREFSSIGSNLRSIFKDAGDTFLNSMISALDVVINILQVVESIKAIMIFLDLLETGAKIAAAPATGGASFFVPSIIGGGGITGQPSQIIIPISIGDQPLQTIIIDTTKKAQRLRYLN